MFPFNVQIVVKLYVYHSAYKLEGFQLFVTTVEHHYGVKKNCVNHISWFCKKLQSSVSKFVGYHTLEI